MSLKELGHKKKKKKEREREREKIHAWNQIAHI